MIFKRGKKNTVAPAVPVISIIHEPIPYNLRGILSKMSVYLHEKIVPDAAAVEIVNNLFKQEQIWRGLESYKYKEIYFIGNTISKASFDKRFADDEHVAELSPVPFFETLELAGERLRTIDRLIVGRLLGYQAFITKLHPQDHKILAILSELVFNIKT